MPYYSVAEQLVPLDLPDIHGARLYAGVRHGPDRRAGHCPGADRGHKPGAHEWHARQGLGREHAQDLVQREPCARQDPRSWCTDAGVVKPPLPATRLPLCRVHGYLKDACSFLAVSQFNAHMLGIYRFLGLGFQGSV